MNATKGYETDRLLVREWHSVDLEGGDLTEVVCSLLTPRVLAPLPPGWQGEYDLERTTRWIERRDQEGPVFLVLEKADRTLIGLVFAFELESIDPSRIDVRLGYLLGESAWGMGFATELVRGFVAMCRGRVSSIEAGVAKGNPASRRVLEKNGFALSVSQGQEPEEEFFVLEL